MTLREALGDGKQHQGLPSTFRSWEEVGHLGGSVAYSSAFGSGRDPRVLGLSSAGIRLPA